MPRILDPEFRMKYGSQLPGGEEMISWNWYDTQTYTSTTTTRLTYFNATNANKVLSNMEVAGQLAAPKYFVIYAVKLVPLILPAEERLTGVGAFAVNSFIDVYRLLFLSRVILTIGSKQYLNHPSSNFTSGQGIYGALTSDAASGATTVYEAHRHSYANNGAPDPRCVYTLTHPRLIEPQINFDIQIEWNAAVTLSGNQNLRVELDGVLYRPIQ